MLKLGGRGGKRQTASFAVSQIQVKKDNSHSGEDPVFGTKIPAWCFRPTYLAHYFRNLSQLWEGKISLYNFLFGEKLSLYSFRLY